MARKNARERVVADAWEMGGGRGFRRPGGSRGAGHEFTHLPHEMPAFAGMTEKGGAGLRSLQQTEVAQGFLRCSAAHQPTPPPNHPKIVGHGGWAGEWPVHSSRPRLRRRSGSRSQCSRILIFRVRPALPAPPPHHPQGVYVKGGGEGERGEIRPIPYSSRPRLRRDSCAVAQRTSPLPRPTTRKLWGMVVGRGNGLFTPADRGCAGVRGRGPSVRAPSRTGTGAPCAPATIAVPRARPCRWP